MLFCVDQIVYKQHEKLSFILPDVTNIFVDVILGKPITRKQKFSKVYTYEELEILGLISIVKSSTDDSWRVKMPYVFFSLLAATGPPEVFQYWNQFKECRWWQQWEEFNCVSTQDMTGVEVTIAKHFRGAYFSPTTGEKTLKEYRDTRWPASKLATRKLMSLDKRP
jgi:hypothetical protein